jgi:hypothetical protein
MRGYQKAIIGPADIDFLIFAVFAVLSNGPSPYIFFLKNCRARLLSKYRITPQMPLAIDS